MKTEEEITKEGNPAKPEGEAGAEMLKRMNESHYKVTGWALGNWRIKESDRILDIGCGGGMTLKRMSKKITTGHLTGVDYSEISVEESLKMNVTDVKSGKMDIVSGSVESLPFDDNSFDKIITVESFYFWPNPKENLKEVLRVLKPNGRFLLVADIYGKEGLSEKAQENIKRFNLFNPTKDEFYELMTSVGFSDVTVKTKDGTDWICIRSSKK